MRTNEYGNLRTLEEDIIWIWKLHGFKVIKERHIAKFNIWEIKAIIEGEEK